MAPPPLAPTICQHAEHQGSKHLACTKWRKFNSSQKQIYEMPASSCRGTVASQPRGMTHASLENHSQQHGGRKCLIVWGRPALPVWSEAVFHVKCAPAPSWWSAWHGPPCFIYAWSCCQTLCLPASISQGKGAREAPSLHPSCPAELPNRHSSSPTKLIVQRCNKCRKQTKAHSKCISNRSSYYQYIKLSSGL